MSSPPKRQSAMADWPGSFRTRLSGDFNLALMAVFTAVSVLALLPFFIYRLASGSFAAALGNGVLIVFLLSVFAFAWLSGRTEVALRAVVVGISLVLLYMVIGVGQPPHWIYPTVVANFMLTRWRFALTVNLVMIGIVLFAAPPDPTLAETLSFAASLTLVAAFSMFFVIHTDFHRERLNVMLEQDALTGALNRRALVGHLERAMRISSPGQQQALVVMDLDDFKQINDLHGHEVGDRVLVNLTRTVMAQTRRVDQFYRLGGEEFVLLLDNTDRAGAEVLLRKLQEALRQPLELEDGPVTVSFGVAFARRGESWPEWLARADQAMYQAKAQGKDRVVFAD